MQVESRPRGASGRTTGGSPGGRRKETIRWTPLDARAFWQAHATLDLRQFQPCFLLSYWAWKNTDVDLELRRWTQHVPNVRFFCDSGAFSAHNAGAVIRWQEYAAWVTRYRHWFTTVANLDVIGDAAATAVNQARLEARGAQVMPVFHVGEPWSVLEHLSDTYTLIGLGGMVSHFYAHPRQLLAWITQCFARTEGRATFHGFGCSTWPLLCSFPWASTDSTSWKAGKIHGRPPLFDYAVGGLFLGTTIQKPLRFMQQSGPLVRRLGMDPRRLFARHLPNYARDLATLGAVSFTLVQCWLNERFATPPLLYLGTDPGDLSYFAPVFALFHSATKEAALCMSS